ncbi:metalloprotease [Psychroflexus sp. ALD_RP9]|uniref:metalloprotease n=1 Tax=Psychroflexus sp. ALD_RP9 TaxID=2777186 RepID=UPI001F5D8289|nr:metalloprotease [Psychroflexus sp. ALD_RP9]
MKIQIYIICCLFISLTYAQQRHKIEAEIYGNDSFKQLDVSQKISYLNNSKQKLDTLFFYDWNNAFSQKTSPLAKRFAEEYTRKFHFSSNEERGFTDIKSASINGIPVEVSRVNQQPDIAYIVLNKALLPQQNVKIQLSYKLQIPNKKFTKVGWSDSNISLKYYLITPAIFNKKWILYSHKDLNDLPLQAIDYNLKVDVPKHLILNSSFENVSVEFMANRNRFTLIEANKFNPDLFLTTTDEFKTVKTDVVEIISNIGDNNLRPEIKAIISDRIAFFLQDKIGNFPHDKIILTETDYNLSPVYGLNQLPAFIRPFPDGFQYDIKLLKTFTRQYLRGFKQLNSRQDSWLLDAICTKLMIDYVKTYYPNMKLLGSFSEFFGVRWFHASDLMFNDRYQFIHETMIRQNLSQPANLPLDEQLKFNQQLSNPYKIGIGLDYLSDYIGATSLQKAIKLSFTHGGHQFSAQEFKNNLSLQTEQEIDWFFDNYIGSYKDIDFKVGNVKLGADSTSIEVINLTRNPMPVKLGLYHNDAFLTSIWVEAFSEESKTISVKNTKANKFVINYDYKLPEFNQRNNTKRKGKLLNKPIQFRFLEDIEDPDYNQVFVIPEFTYNLYDGLALGTKLYNTSLLPKNFSYKISPKYGLGSNALVGSAGFDHKLFFKQQPLFQITYGLNGSRFSYNNNLFYNRYSGFLQFSYRPANLRDNRRHYLTLRSVNVDQDESPIIETEEPNYNVFNINYSFQNKNLDHFFTTSVDYEIAKKFSKLSASVRYRKLFNNNRQINLRFFTGLFLFNDNNDSDYFSFGIDRPTDYLFDYNYYGRSEDSGVFSQQFIMADAGFKSIFQDRFANQWISSVNMSTTIWNWIFAYGDAGFFKDSASSAQFIYDSGIRLNLVEDYFELYFPVYSNNGWELAEDAYDQRIRFIATLDFKTLLGLFKRKWY